MAFNGSGAPLTSLNGSNISSGTVAAARLGSGTPGSGNFLRGDGSWQVIDTTPPDGSITDPKIANDAVAGSVYVPAGAERISRYTAPTSYQFFSNAKALRSGSYNFRIRVRNDNDGSEISTTIYARVYLNGSAVGSEGSVSVATNTSSTITVSNISLTAEQTVQIYLRAANSNLALTFEGVQTGTTVLQKVPGVSAFSSVVL